MDELFITLLFFIFIFSCHVVLHRVLALWGIRTVRTVWFYVLGCIPLLIVIQKGLLSYPVSAVCVYVFLSIGISVTYITFFLGAQTPASTILYAFSKRRVLSKKSIILLFTKEHIFDKRIENLMSFTLVGKNGRRYVATPCGLLVAGAIWAYERIFARPTGG
jgi:hypothetical protein